MNSKIKKLVWSEKLTLLDATIDNQHKNIFNLINDIIDTDQLYPKSDKFAKTLSQLSDYGLIHFQSEEELMKKLNYPKFAEHKTDHLNYIYKVSMFNLNFRDVNHTQPRIVLKFIRDWWFNHILDMDMDFSNFIRQTL